MIDKGVNPYIVRHDNQTQFDGYSLLLNPCLNIPEMPKSVYFSVYPDSSYPTEMQEAWFYTNGVFPGEFEEIIGKGCEGHVISGKWMGVDVAYKFIEIKNPKLPKRNATVRDGLKDLKKRLTELNALKATKGSCILREYGHFQ